jgi:transposase
MEDVAMPSVISDALWDELAPLVTRAKRTKAGSPPDLPDRQFLEALLFLADSGCKWRQLPERYGAWDAVYNRYRRWLAAGIFERMFADLPDLGPPLDGVRRVFVDSTVIRAHASAAGAPAKKGGKPSKRSGVPVEAFRPKSISPARMKTRWSGSS